MIYTWRNKKPSLEFKSHLNRLAYSETKTKIGLFNLSPKTMFRGGLRNPEQFWAYDDWSDRFLTRPFPNKVLIPVVGHIGWSG